MTAVKRGTTQVIVPRAQPSAAHDIERAAALPKTKDGDTFEVRNNKAASTGPAGSLRRQVAVDEGASGAWFHKIVGPSRADAHGMRVEGRLPDVVLSKSRWQLNGDASNAALGGGPVAMTKSLLESQPLSTAMAKLNHYTTGPLDKPSVYLGGRSGHQEADVGLSFDRVYDSAGRAVFTNQPEGAAAAALRDPKNQFVFDAGTTTLKDGTGAVVAKGEADVKKAMIDNKLAPSFAFRPYWRVSPTEPGTTNWSNPPVSNDAATLDKWSKATNHTGAPPTNAYFYPGEKFAMNVRDVGRGELRLDIRGNGDDATIPAFGVGIRASAFGKGAAQEFKRVSSIDQKGREKKDVVATSSMAIGLEWEKTEVLLGAARTPTALSSLSSTQVRGRELAASDLYDRIFNTDLVDGTEIVSIRP